MGKKRGKKGSKFPAWTVFLTFLMILTGILAGINFAEYVETSNPEGLSEITGLMFVGAPALGMAIVFASIGGICFVILIFIWGR